MVHFHFKTENLTSKAITKLTKVLQKNQLIKVTTENGILVKENV